MKLSKNIEVSSQRRINHISEGEEGSPGLSQAQEYHRRIKTLNQQQLKANYQLSNTNHYYNHLPMLNTKLALNHIDLFTTANQTPIADVKAIKKNLSVINPLEIKPINPLVKYNVLNSSTKDTNKDSSKSNKKILYSLNLHSFKQFNEGGIGECSTSNILLNNQLPKCILCNRIYPSDMIVTTGQCNHLYCYKCIKQLFKEQLYYNANPNSNVNTNVAAVTNNDPNGYKCPIASCNEYFKNGIITSILPSIYSSTITEKGERNKGLIDDMVAIKDNNQFKQYKYHHISKQSSIKYNQSNVIDVNSNKKLFFFIKKNETACPFCFDKRTFNKRSTDYYICLNCLKYFCKHCRKAYNDFHFDQIGNANYCKIYFRKKKRERNTIIWQHWMKFWVVFGLIIMSYFVIQIGFMLTLYRAMAKKPNCSNSKLFRGIVMIVIGMIYLILFPLFIMSIPYYPIITLF